jgi:DNA replication ATP-dependent helicase Dna2
MVSVHTLIEKLLESPQAQVTETGGQLLEILSGGRLGRDEFISDPLSLIGPPYFASRYLAQVALRALRNDYETLEEVIASLHGVIERNPPILEPKREAAAARVVLPEAKVLDIRLPKRNEKGHWESSFDALVTSGPLRDREVHIRLSSQENKTACFLAPYLWIHAGIAAYNLVPSGENAFEACPETFIVVEPMHQVNATTIARSLYCTKPQVDQIRRGKGDVTVHTLKGQLVHALFDRMLEGQVQSDADLDAIYRAVLPGYLMPLASVTDEFFDEEAFRGEVLRHTTALKEFIERHPHLLEHTQLELKRYSATIGIQGRIDAVFREGNRLDILELKTGARIRPEDHAQLFIYRLLLSDLIRRWQRSEGQDVEITTRLLSSTDGSFAPLRVMTDFYQVLDARNKLIAAQYAISRGAEAAAQIPTRYEGFNEDVCRNCPSWTRARCKDSSNAFGDRPGAAETLELEYFRKYTQLVQRERWNADQDLADLLDDSRLPFRVGNFRAICGVRIVQDAKAFTFEFDENTSDLEIGDSVLIHSGRVSSSATYHGHVAAIDTRGMRVSIPLKNLDPRVFEGQDWIVDRFPSDVTAEASHTALYDFLVSPMDDKKRAILGVPNEPQRHRDTGKYESSQQEAIDRAVHCDVFHLIWGPPGTGKTRVIPEIVKQVDGPILLGAFTNTAVDKMLAALLDHDPETRFLRVGRASDSPELVRRISGDSADYFTDDLARKYGTVRAVRDALKHAPIVAATAHRASTLPYLRLRGFEMAIVDEAGQLTEPLTLGLILRARRFVLIGDDRQLPPVVRTRGLAHSMFERLKRDRDAVTLLETQYRMHPGIMSVSNRLFYDGRLKSGVTERDRRLNGEAGEQPVTFIPVESRSDARSNPAEAGVVREIVESFIREQAIAPENIGVVSPFRAQVVLLRQMLAGLGVTVDTVERFQGGERDVMILSFVRSRGTGFVFDDRRLNVAITRARRKLVLVAHPELFLNSKYEWICTFTEPLKIAGRV